LSHATEAGNAFLEVSEIVKRYDGGGGVDNVSVDVAKGDMLVLLGPSGSGKTTLLRSIAGLEQPDGGDVVIGGTRMTGVPVYRRGVGMVFQTWALFPYLSVEDNVAFGLRMARVGRREIEKRVSEALELVRMGAFAKRKPAQLSGGQQQRVALARAVVTRPAILLFDEPLSSLDHKIRLELRSQLRQIQRELGLTGVYVTHDHAEALALGDEIAVMCDGRVVERGTPVEIFTAPRHAFTAEFLSVGAVVPISEVAGDVVTTDQGLQLHLAPGRSAEASAKRCSVLIPTRAVRLVRGTPSTEGSNDFDGEVVNLEFEHTSVLCTVRIDGTETDLRSSEPLDSAVTIGSRVKVKVDSEALSVLRA
jgi:ABC-type Fe3+/spermidine/putrescine transport system ATPase subunit